MDGQNERQTDAKQSYPYEPLVFVGQKQQKVHKNSGSIPRNACVACET